MQAICVYPRCLCLYLIACVPNGTIIAIQRSIHVMGRFDRLKVGGEEYPGHSSLVISPAFVFVCFDWLASIL